MWFIGTTAFLFNGAVIATRITTGDKMGQNILILQLALSDLFMGVNMLMLASVDLYYSRDFPSFSDTWRESILCRIAAALSTFSSEASVFFVTLISYERYLGVRYPLGFKGIGKKRSKIGIAICWFISIVIAVVPSALLQKDLFDLSEVCVGIPILKKPLVSTKDVVDFISMDEYRPSFRFSYAYQSLNITHGQVIITQVTATISFLTQITVVIGRKVASYLSIIVFIGINLTCFVAIAVFYCRIFIVARSSTANAGYSNRDKETQMAIKMSMIVMTDFCCWVPLAFVCLLVQCGLISISPEMYTWTVGLILPINSSVNPFLYTIGDIITTRLHKLQATSSKKSVATKTEKSPSHRT